MIIVEHKNGPYALRMNRTNTGYVEIQMTPRGRKHLVTIKEFIEMMQMIGLVQKP